jgi:hypothetical protein
MRRTVDQRTAGPRYASRAGAYCCPSNAALAAERSSKASSFNKDLGQKFISALRKFKLRLGVGLYMRVRHAPGAPPNCVRIGPFA